MAVRLERGRRDEDNKRDIVELKADIDCGDPEKNSMKDAELRAEMTGFHLAA